MSHHRLFKLRQLPHVAVAIAAAATGSAALAQVGNAATGATLYSQNVMTQMFGMQSCNSCHGAGNSLYLTLARNTTPTEASVLAAINGAIGGNRGGMGAYSTWTAQQRADVAAYVVGQSPAPPPPFGGGGGTKVATPAATPNPATFANTAVGGRSAAVTIMVTNAATSSVTFGSQPVQIVGNGNSGDFWVNATPTGMAACTGTLAPGMS
jgi:mono/diheme cytochrome c family protein